MTRTSLLKLLEEEALLLKQLTKFEDEIVGYMYRIEDSPASDKQEYETSLEYARQNFYKTNRKLYNVRMSIRRYLHDLSNPDGLVREYKERNNEQTDN